MHGGVDIIIAVKTKAAMLKKMILEYWEWDI